MTKALGLRVRSRNTKRILATAGMLAAAVTFIPLNTIHAQTATQRIVAVGPSVAEIVYALGAGSQLVGVDGSSQYPVEVQKLPRVGIFMALPAEGVLALRPTVLVGTKDIKPPTALSQIRDAGVKVELVSTAENLESALQKIREVGTAIGRSEQGVALAKRLGDDVGQTRAVVGKAATKPRVLFIYARGGGTLLVAGRANQGNSIIELAGGQNAIDGFDGFKPLTAEAVLAARPDYILLPEKGLAAVGGVDGLLKLPGLALTPAGKAKRIVAMDDEFLLGFGPRLGDAVRQLASQIHPELKAQLAK